MDDVLDDAACLAMDLERLGGPDLGAGFLHWCKERRTRGRGRSGTTTWPTAAFMRSKVACLREAKGSQAGQARL